MRLATLLVFPLLIAAPQPAQQQEPPAQQQEPPAQQQEPPAQQEPGEPRGAQAPDPAELVRRLRSQDVEAVESAVAAAPRAGANAVPALVAMLAPGGEAADPAIRHRHRLATLRALWGIARHATAPDEDQRLAQEHRRNVATAMLDALAGGGDLPAASRRELLRMIGEVANDRASVLRIAEWLEQADTAEAALFALQRAAHPAAGQALVERLERPGALPARAFVDALGARRATAAVEPLLALAKGDDEDLARRARSALARIGDPRAAPVLAAALQVDPPENADDWLRFAALQRPEGALRAAMLTGYGLLLQRGEPYLRQAGIRGLLDMGADGAARTLLALLEDPDEAVRRTAQAALIALGEEGLDATLLSTLSTAGPELRPQLLRVLAARETPGAKAALEAVARDPLAADRAVALELLGAFPDPELEELLLSASELEDAEPRQAAAASLYRHALAAEAAGDVARAQRLLHAVLGASTENDELRRDAITAVGSLADPDSLPHLEPFAEDGRFRDSVAAARAEIALAMAAEDPDRAVQLMLAAYRLSTSRGQRREAARHLLDMGFDAGSLIAQSGFLQDWQVLAPWPAADAETLASHPFDRAGPDPTQTVELGNRTLSWRPVHTDDPDGIVDLRRLVSGTNVSAFALATLDWHEDAPMKLKLGSDDGVAVWVNGELVHDHFVRRGITVDQDSCDVNLRKGANWILLRIDQGGGDWGFTARLCDAEGRPIDLSSAR